MAWAQELQLGPDTEKALKALQAGDPAPLRKRAADGDAGARVVLGGMLFSGAYGLQTDKPQACGLWREASADSPYASHLYAECKQFGHDGQPDPAQARTRFEAAGARGFLKSHCALGNMLIAGEGGPKDAARGVALCRQAAEGGDADAQTDLANFYLTGEIVPKDMVEARRWYTPAAAKRQKNAAYVLGQIYWNGDGVAKDRAKAIELWRVAYEEGRTDAALLLGNEAFTRVLLPAPDGAKRQVDRAALDEAIAWFERAIAEDPGSAEKASKGLKIARDLKAALS